MYAGNVLQVVWTLEAQDKVALVLPFTVEARMGVLALGGIGAGGVVEPQADGAAIFCPVVGTKGRAISNRADCCTVTIFVALGTERLGM